MLLLSIILEKFGKHGNISSNFQSKSLTQGLVEQKELAGECEKHLPHGNMARM